jgi:hypothetical protein
MPPVHTQADLHRHWRALMGPLGFGSSRLFVVFVSLEGRVHPRIMDIEELPDLPDPELVGTLMAVLASLLDAVHPAGTRVAVLYARPGRRGPSRADRAWASAVLEAGRRRGVPLWPVHLANDEELLVATPDDLVDSA